MEKNNTDILYYDGRIIFVEFNYRFMWCSWFNQKLLGCRIPFYANI